MRFFFHIQVGVLNTHGRLQRQLYCDAMDVRFEGHTDGPGKRALYNTPIQCASRVHTSRCADAAEIFTHEEEQGMNIPLPNPTQSLILANYRRRMQRDHALRHLREGETPVPPFVVPSRYYLQGDDPRLQYPVFSRNYWFKQLDYGQTDISENDNFIPR